ncbi:SRPBCC family protein [Herpetosiphon geysericola]|uniref:Polyketide cyclase n=1 Tax=Herpetosiphon geysericola TaxID=70996 RepID=A0A0P6XX97_9CHLR|nr:SRPBCC family protein [Herpetosiphon geysericola]KPL81149.1 hypothetical protein SE18_20835 [Herpetosiphon geysericola]
MPIGHVSFVNTCSITAPPAFCFGYISDFEHDPEWWPSLASSQRICGHGMGAIYEQFASVGALQFSSLIEITAYTPHESMEFTITSHGVMICLVRYEFSEQDGLTTFTMRSQIRFLPLWLRLVAPLFQTILVGQVVTHFAILKQTLEQAYQQTLGV